jgi:hypothetical protein
LLLPELLRAAWMALISASLTDFFKVAADETLEDSFFANT